MRRLALAAWVVASVCLCSAGGAAACGFAPPEVEFWYQRRPAEPLERFLAGHLGIVDHAWDRAYRYVAWRHLSGLGLDTPSREALASYWQTVRPATEPYDRPSFELWRDARARVPGTPYIYPIYPARMVRKTVNGVERWLFYQNCLDDAFRAAARTLDDRIATFGAGSEIVRAWVTAQDQVFSNCGDSPASLPAPLSDSPSPAVAADRAYQIAAAHFYAGEFAEAERQFRAIAQDEASPWKVMAAYLVGRALVRQGTVDEPENSERLQAAVAHLRGVLADPSLAEVHGPAERLLGYALLQLDPADRARTLLRELRAPVLGPTAGSTLFDYLWLLRREEGRGMYYPRGFGTISILDPSASLGESPFEFDEVGVWLLGYYPVDHWRRTRSLPWLVAAMTAVGPTQPDRDALLAAAEKVPRDSPAYPTLAYHRMRLMIAEGHLEHARRELDRLLAEPEGTFAAGDRNRLQALRAPLATNLDEFLRLAQKVPVGVSYDDGEVPFRSVSQPELAALRGQPMLDDDAADMLNRDFTPAMLLEVARRDALVARLRSDVARAAWVRALLLAEWELADQIGLLVAQLAPDLGPEVDAMGAAASPAREFTVAFMLLRLPRLQHEIGARGEEPWSAWRCAAAGDPARRNAVAPALAFQTDDQRAAVAAMHERLRALQPGQLWLGRTVLAWADQHPEDPRVPEALHQVVHQSREECTRDRSAMVQRAFRRLHRRYPSSLWTVKTPYWHR